MMSQMTNGIFASANPVVHVPTPRPAKTPATGSKLIVTDAEGHALETWVIKQAKCTLGSADSCTICCTLPGIAPIHALIVSGARQSFVRSLAGKLSQDGIPASELLLSDQKSYFELAGYRFSLIRQTNTATEEERLQAKRMRFALARPLSISSQPEPIRQAPVEDTSVSSPWVANIIREAIEPLEAQIDSLLLPLAEFQAQSMQAQLAAARELEEERRKAELEKQRAYEEELKAKQIAADRLRESEDQRKQKEQEIVSMVAQQSANMETLTERISDVNNQLATIERIIAQDAEQTANHSAQTNGFIAQTNNVIAVQQTAIEQLQTGIVSVSESLKQLQERQQAAQTENLTWKNEVQLQLQQLTSAVSEFSDIAKNANQPELIDVIESLKTTHEEAQVEIQRWQEGVQKQLFVLQDKLEDAKSTTNDEVSDRLAVALAEIQSKHEQSLAELQVWKAELRQEMQQILLSAAQSTQSNAVADREVSHSQHRGQHQASAAEVDSALTSFAQLHQPLTSQPVVSQPVVLQPAALSAATLTAAILPPTTLQPETLQPATIQPQSLSELSQPVLPQSVSEAPSVAEVPVATGSPASQPLAQNASVPQVDGNGFPSYPSAQPVSTPSYSYPPQANSGASDQDEGLYYGADDANREPVTESEPTFSSFLGQQFSRDLAEPITPEFVSEEMIGAAELQMQAQNDLQWSGVESTENNEPTQWPSMMLDPSPSGSNTFGDQANTFGDQWAGQSESGVFENQSSQLVEGSWNQPLETNAATELPSLAGFDTTSREAEVPTQPNASSFSGSETWGAPVDSTNGQLDQNLDYRPQTQPDSAPQSSEIESLLPNWNGTESSPDPLNAFADLLKASQPTSELQAAESSSSADRALPSWWTEAAKEDDFVANASQPQESQQPEELAAGFDLSHLYQDSSDQSNAESQFNLGSHQAQFGAMADSFEPEPEIANNEIANNAIANNDTTSQGFSFDRFVQREQQLETEQNQIEPSSIATSSPILSSVASDVEASTAVEKSAHSSSLNSASPVSDEYHQIEEVEYQLPEAYHKLEAASPTSQGLGGSQGFGGSQGSNQNHAAGGAPASRTSSDHGNANGGEEDDSVEAYMKNLLARMRGTPENAVEEPVAPVAPPSSYAPTRPSPYELRNAMREEQIGLPEDLEPMDLDSYVPLTNAPEKSKNISALRELANSTARTAIHKSTRRKTLSGSLMKFAISAIALTVAAALFAINGVAVNIALIATMAALFVALIWGYDGLKSLKPLLQNSLVLQPNPNAVEPTEPEDD